MDTQAHQIPPETEFIVCSSAIKKDNEELKEARKRKLPILHRSDMLEKLMRDKKKLIVTGCHGKTTTTAMVSDLFYSLGQDPSISLGGILKRFQSAGHEGQGEYFIAEADESDGSFHKFSPDVLILTNIDRDHLDFYGDFEGMKKSFLKFLKNLNKDTLILACGDCENLKDRF